MMSEAQQEGRHRGGADPLRRHHLGSLNGVVPPTGKRFAARQSHWFRIQDGKLAEHWATREDLVAMLQLGVVQAPGRPPA